MSDLLIFSNDDGLITASGRGKVLLLIIVQVLMFWVIFLIFYQWNQLTVDSTGEAVVYLSIISLSFLFLSIFFSNFFRSVTRLWVKQFSIVLFLIADFILILHFSSTDVSGNNFYDNPVNMSYLFLLIYSIFFLIASNFYNENNSRGKDQGDIL